MTPTWQTDDGRVRLWLADCLDVLPHLSGVDAVVTDPPYSVSLPGVAHVGRNGDRRNLDFFDCDHDWDAMTKTVRDAAEICRVQSSPGASHYWWCGHRQFGHLVADYESNGWKTKFLVWSKMCPAPPPPWSGWPSGAELCVYAYREGRKWNLGPQDVPKSNVLIADSYRHGMPGKVDHPTQKPFEVITPPVEASTDPEDLVCDCFMGSGTVGIEAVRLGRRFVGIEKEPRFFELAQRRIAAALGHEVREAGGVIQKRMFVP